MRRILGEYVGECVCAGLLSANEIGQRIPYTGLFKEDKIASRHGNNNVYTVKINMVL